MTRKIIAFQIPKPSKEFVRFQVDEDRHFYDKLHQHPEWQLTMILEGKGQLMVGDYLGRFEPGDIGVSFKKWPFQSFGCFGGSARTSGFNWHY